MNNIINTLFQYGYHDTEITSIESSENTIILYFNNGLYFLDESGKETSLSSPLKIIIEINKKCNSLDYAVEIREFGRKLKYLDFRVFKSYFLKEPFSIAMAYFSNLGNTLLFDGGFTDKQILFSIESIEKVSIVFNNKT